VQHPPSHGRLSGASEAVLLLGRVERGEGAGRAEGNASEQTSSQLSLQVHEQGARSHKKHRSPVPTVWLAVSDDSDEDESPGTTAHVDRALLRCLEGYAPGEQRGGKELLMV
jgi:hypothetical protein